MSALVLALRDKPAYPLDVSRLRPDLLGALSERQIGELPLWDGNTRYPLGDLFRISGKPASGALVLKDSCERLDGVGAEMNGGSLIAEGPVGDFLGRGLKSGEIRVEGACGDFACTAMGGGTVEVEGNAGDFLGAPLSGERVGMRGGTVIVRGGCGDRGGERQRRGLILVEGDAGAYCGCNMIAGTLVVLGRAGKAAGFGMRRGTVLLGREPLSIPSTFYQAGLCTMGFVDVLSGSLSHLDGPFGRLAERGNRVARSLGDRACAGQGEILVWAETS